MSIRSSDTPTALHNHCGRKRAGGKFHGANIGALCETASSLADTCSYEARSRHRDAVSNVTCGRYKWER
jgi:hypothetical protein